MSGVDSAASDWGSSGLACLTGPSDGAATIVGGEVVFERA